MRRLRLGDDIDDHCLRCKRITNHLIVSFLEGRPAKVRCRSCYYDHDYSHEQGPPPKKVSKRKALGGKVAGAGGRSKAQKAPAKGTKRGRKP